MDSGPTLVNCASIFYQYSVNPNENPIKNCTCAQKSIQVTPKIKICYSECREDTQCGLNQKSYIKAYNLSEYPIEIKLRVYLPSYAHYDPSSFTINGSRICCVCLTQCLNFGVIMPCASVTANYCLYRKPNNTSSSSLSRVEIFYRICLPGKLCNKWYYKTEDVCII